MIDKDKELEKELGQHRKTNEFQQDLSDHIDTMLAYGPYKLGLNNVKKESSGEERIKQDLEK